ncbi:bifunctional diaminohydroxyphosphoribosylaminopyrimidine deaminase/5-amino-6-(5-phosphoribosylamino)uracil reductase RibD [Pseudohoeflea coraliihabitans]|uniref:Riboflavin biosynthesis protein RibD n=1 Tax=Pseudohoeflea coraliihabitans TaxID=2860393 RepID=A0ABS6WS22_9HYPH|nr:bifunctional diaminohydroxyphosphoribosylaminopyrimidine deaminase/5-amino-6-(5-phosphoribosylamino)uracil reductase RibD [Pseudohoeflea sp. DP4N28-3]MBW3098768.1 bifunctional diaminohydroxyphosphoribosylaminopyrimidine deaminase/5-amino-6-(5-phosphoribosylamino)uracil reductase RibD [Pseudohoeflea sp. DP4N28-3]
MTGRPPSSDLDRRYMAAAIRLARLNEGRTGANPSVATLLVRDFGQGPVIIGSGVTALGGRPHAEPQALAEAGERARGATAYVTLEPCAHHGRTAPCADALVSAGVARVVGAAGDPDPRVCGRGYEILRRAGIEVEEGVLADNAARDLAGYLTRRTKNRLHVTLKLALSADGLMGLRGTGQVALTGEIANRQVHLMRAASDIILIGSGTALADDPALTCRLPGLEDRSPIRLVLDDALRLDPASQLAASARRTPLWIASSAPPDADKRPSLAALGAEFIAAEPLEGKLALPELLEDLAARGLSTLFVEGGAAVARSFLDEDLVDRLVLMTAPQKLADIAAGEGIVAPLTRESVPARFKPLRTAWYGPDRMDSFERQN